MRTSLRSALDAEKPLVTPLAQDALSARLIEAAGFKAFSIGGSAMLAARYALPDLGLIGLTDMTSGIRDIADVTSIPFMADGDDGYGDTKNVVRMIAAYERLGVGGILIEDQDRNVKQQRAEKALRVVDEAVIGEKLRVTMASRTSAETLIIGRTDAYGVLGLDAALARAERFLKLGVDGLFIAGLRQEEDYEKVGRTFRGEILSAAMFEGGDTPWLTPAQLGEMGFRHVSFPSSLVLRAVAAIKDGLESLKAHADGSRTLIPFGSAAAARKALDTAIGTDEWLRRGVGSTMESNRNFGETK